MSMVKYHVKWIKGDSGQKIAVLTTHTTDLNDLHLDYERTRLIFTKAEGVLEECNCNNL